MVTSSPVPWNETPTREFPAKRWPLPGGSGSPLAHPGSARFRRWSGCTGSAQTGSFAREDT